MSKAEPNNTSFTRHVTKNFKGAIVWQVLTPGIDPFQWTELCRKIGQLDPRTFTAFYHRFIYLEALQR